MASGMNVCIQTKPLWQPWKHLCKATVMAHAIYACVCNLKLLLFKASHLNTSMQWILQQYHAPDSWTRKDFYQLDLTYGYPLNVTMYDYLLQNGMTKEEFAGLETTGESTMYARQWLLCDQWAWYFLTGIHRQQERSSGYYVITPPVLP